MADPYYPMYDVPQMPLLFEDEPRVVFVDTDLNTHLAIFVSPLMNFADLKKQIALEHIKSFPAKGKRVVENIRVPVLGTLYLIPDGMLVKQAYYGIANSWILYAETFKEACPFKTRLAKVNHLKPIHQLTKKKKNKKPIHQELKLNHVEPSDQHHADQHLQPPDSKNHECQHGKPSHLDQNYKPMETPNIIQQTNQSNKALSLMATPDTRDKKKNKRSKKRKGRENIDGKTDALLKTVSQDKKGEDTAVKHVNGSGVGQNVVTDVRENLNKESEIVSFESPAEPLAKKSKKKESGIDGVAQNHPAISVKGLAGDLPSNNDTIIHESEQKDDNTNLAEKLNKESEILNFESQPGAQAKKSKKKKSGINGATQNHPATSAKVVAGDAPSNTGTTIYESEQKGYKTDGGVLPSHLNNVLEPLSQQEPLNLSENEKKIADDVAPVNLENTAKKRKTNKAKSSSKGIDGATQNHPATSAKVVAGDAPSNTGTAIYESEQKGYKTDGGVLPSHLNNVPLSQQEPLNLSENEKKIADDVAPVNLENTAKKRKTNKAKSSSKKVVEEPDEKIEVDDTLTKCDNSDSLFKSENDAKVFKIYDTDKECRRTADVVSQSLLDDILKVALSQDEPLNVFEEEKEIKEVIAPSKSENTAKRRKSKAKSCGTVNQDLSSRRDDEDEKADGSRQTCAELSQSDDIGRIEERLETFSGKVKKSRNRKAVPVEDPCVQDQPDEEKSGEESVPISVIQSDKPKKTRKKQPILGKDRPVDQQLDEKLVDMEAPDRVKQVVDSYQQKKVMQSEGHEDKVSEILPLEASSGSAHPEKPRACKQKAKKLDQTSSIDISSSGHNLSVSKKNRGSVEVLKEQVNVASVIHASVDDGIKVSGAKLATELEAPERAEESFPDNKSSDTQNQKALKAGEEHQSPGLESSAVSDEVRQLKKPLAYKKKTKKADQPSSIDTSSSRHLVRLEKNQGLEKTPEVQISNAVQKHKKVTDSDRSKASEASSMIAGSKVRNIYQEAKAEKPLNTLGEDDLSFRRSSRLSSKKVLGASAQKKGLLDSSEPIFEEGNCSSSDGGYQSHASSFSATDDSDHSEVESGGVVKSRHDSSKDQASIKAESSGIKLESILKSSSRYKKAKLVASQSQDESEPPEFVPDSQGLM